MIQKFWRSAGASRRRSIGAAAVASVAAASFIAATASGHQGPQPFTGFSHRSLHTVFNRSHEHGRDHGGQANSTAVAVNHVYTTPGQGALAVDAEQGVLAGDRGGALQITDFSQPQHGSLTLNPDGSFNYHPALGFSGTDTFTYTVSNAVHLYTDHLPPLGTVGGVSLNAGGFGSSVYPDPGHPGFFYGLEDRGPNVTAPDGNMVLPIPSYDPSIGLFQMVGNDAVLIKKIPLQGPDGQPYSGMIPPESATGEGVAADINGTQLSQDQEGYDSEGLVAMPDGTFWVSDEYGPYITHFNQDGDQIQRFSPYNGTLPAELQYRVANKGMEGLTVTPDGKELVGIMQSSLQQPDIGTLKATKLVPTRIVTIDLRTHAEHEYLYMLHNPAANGTAVSEIAALSDTTFLVDERDGCFPGQPGMNPPTPGAAPTECATTPNQASFKQLYKIDISHATDVGPDAHVRNATYVGNFKVGQPGGLLVGGKSIEDLVSGDTTTTDAAAALEAAGIAPASSSLFLDVNTLLGSVNPQFGFYSHDKMEGVAVVDNGNQIVISNDSDFGITAADFANGTTPPYTLEEKLSPVTGEEDNGEYLAVDMNRVTASGGADASNVSTGTVTINVKAAN
jgi:hypothetical protein